MYGNNTNAGVATVTVVGMGDFEGGVKKTFSIAPKSLDDLKINYFREITYRGAELRLCQRNGGSLGGKQLPMESEP